MAPESPLFDSEFLKKLEYLHVISKRAFSGQFKAERRARTRGTGLEFADHRAYSPGDDFRHVDWKAYQRLNKLLLRLFEEEQDLPIFVFLDSSRSMFEGTPPRFNYAQKIAAALCYIGLAHLDRVSLFSILITYKRNWHHREVKAKSLRYLNSYPSSDQREKRIRKEL